MSKMFWKSLIAGSALLGVAWSVSVATQAKADTAAKPQSNTLSELDNYSTRGSKQVVAKTKLLTLTTCVM